MAFGFDEQFYMLNNQDVARAVANGLFPDAYTHYLQFGARELRSPNADFNAVDYLALNPDVAAAVSSGMFASAWEHYLAFGMAEGRAPSQALSGFNATAYLSQNGDVAAAVAAGHFKSAMEHYLQFGKSEGRGTGNDIHLTNGTDILTGNSFVAEQVYTPGGTDRINSLQDEDVLTGTGSNPTLTATLGNFNDNGASTVAPALNGIQTLNVAFTASDAAKATNILDLGAATGLTGAVNISRITDQVSTVSLRNMTAVPAELSIANTQATPAGINFLFTQLAVAAETDATRLTLSNARTDMLTVQSVDASGGIETITIVSDGSADNSIGSLNAAGLVTLNITGSQALSIGQIYDNAVGRFTAIDGSTATGNLTLTLGAELKADMEGSSGTGVPVNFSVKTGSGNDTLNVTVAEAGNAADVIAMGTGTDTVAYTVDDDAILTSANSASYTGVEAISITRTGSAPVAIAIDLSRLNSDTGTDQSIRLTNAGSNGQARFQLDNLTAGEARQITVTHGATDVNGIYDTDVIANLADASGANDTVAVTIVDGVNDQPRFNFTLTAGGSTDATRVENITLIDNDTESNSVSLTNLAHHTGTITLQGGVAGQFLNLDTTENVQGLNLSGAASNDGLYGSNAPLANPDGVIASVVDAESYVGDVIIRLSSSLTSISATGAQTVRMGSGNDLVIFDNLNDSRAGLTIADTVSGGAGLDTLAIGGNQAVVLGGSEWTNVSGFETIRLLGNQASYSLTLTDQLIRQNAADGKLINIVNDNVPSNDATGSVGLINSSVSAATIDARDLSVGLGFTYDGEEGSDATADRFIFNDRTLSGTSVIDGGAADNSAATGNANSDVLEIRNSAVISVADLANIRNVGTIELTNDLAATQNFILSLNDQLVDQLVDSHHTASATSTETLTIRALDNAQVSGAATGLELDAGSLTIQSSLSLLLGRGNNTITTGAGDDRVVLLGNFATGAYSGLFETGLEISSFANDVAGTRLITDTINLGDGEDTLVTYGNLNLTSATLAVENIVSNSGLVLTAAQFNALKSLTFIGAGTHEIYIINDPSSHDVVDLSKIKVLGGGSVSYNLDAGLTTTGSPSGTVTLVPSLTAESVGTGVPAGKTYNGILGTDDVFTLTAAELVNATINGNATDNDTLAISDALTATINNGNSGGTLNNVKTLILDGSGHDVSFAGTPGFTQITAGAGGGATTRVDVSGLGGGFAAGNVNMLATAGTLTLGGQSYTGQMNAGGSNDTLVLTNGADISGATIIGFETLSLTTDALVTMTAEQYKSFDAATATTGTATVIVKSNVPEYSTYLLEGIRNYDFSGIVYGMNLTIDQEFTSITGASGNDYVTFESGKHSGSYDGNTGENGLYLKDGADISNVTISNVGSWGIDDGATATMSINQIATHAGYLWSERTGTVKAAASSDNATIQANYSIKAYDLSAATGNLVISTESESYLSGLIVENTITGGAGNDTINVHDVARGKTTVDLGAGGSDRVNINNPSHDAGATAAVIIENFTASGPGADMISLGVTGFESITTAITTPTNFDGKLLGLSSAFTAGDNSAADNGALETAIINAIGQAGDNYAQASTFHAVIYLATGNVALTQVRIASGDLSTGIVSGNITVELIGQMNGIAPDSLTAANFV